MSTALGDILGGGFGLAGSLLSGGINYAINKKQSDLAYKRAKEFAQNSVTWRMQDAKRAGVNPLFALGMGGSSYQGEGTFVGFGDMGNSLGVLGSGLGESFSRSTTASERRLMDAHNQLRLENMRLQNDLLKSQIRSNDSAVLSRINQTPPIPSISKASPLDLIDSPDLNRSNRVQVVPQEIDAKMKGKGFYEAGVPAENRLVQSDKDSYTIYPANSISDYISDSILGSALWHVKNYIGGFWPSSAVRKAPPRRDGYIIHYNPYTMTYTYTKDYKSAPFFSYPVKDYRMRPMKAH